jgi:tripeptide aminopeptidase
MTVLERLLQYVKIPTQSVEDSKETPSSQNVFVLAELLCEQLREIGASNVRLDRLSGCVYAELPATDGLEEKKKIGFIAHMDTSPDFSGSAVCPQIIENYDGTDVVLGNSGRILRVSDFPNLKKQIGRTLITTDGNTLLGADDKAGIACIMDAAQKIIEEKIPHGKICIAFTPDEEVGRGTDGFDIAGFGADFAYTVDGGEEGEIVSENFNAASAVLNFNGFNVHPGSAKNTMINATKVAIEFDTMLPSADTPSQTEDYEGFFHLCSLEGSVEKAVSVYIIRDHDSNLFEARKKTIEHIVKTINEKYGEHTVTLSLQDSYYNMAPLLKNCSHLIENAKEVIESIGLTPITSPIRGGTDGARLTYSGLPCPNLGTGGHAFHGPYEYITKEGLELSARILLGIIQKYAE